MTPDNTQLYVTRFLSFTRPGGKQGDDDGKEGVVCRLDINTASNDIGGYAAGAGRSRLRRSSPASRSTRAATAPPIRRRLPEPAAEHRHPRQPGLPAEHRRLARGPAAVRTSTRRRSSTSSTASAARRRPTCGALNLHLGARDPEPGKKKLFFANPWAIAFTTQAGAGNAYVVSAGSDLLVKLNVDADGNAELHRATPTRPATSTSTTRSTRRPAAPTRARTRRASSINAAGTRAYVANFVSRNISVVDLRHRQRRQGHPHHAAAAARLAGGAGAGRGGDVLLARAATSTGRRHDRVDRRAPVAGRLADLRELPLQGPDRRRRLGSSPRAAQVHPAERHLQPATTATSSGS